MDSEDIFEAAKARGLARSRRQFTTGLLGMAPNHAAETGLARRSADALLNLHRRLGELGHADLQARVAERLLAAGTQVGNTRGMRP